LSQPTMSMESTALLSSLSDQRDHVLGILEGLSDEALRRPVLPSGRTCLGLVRHLAIDVERFWFRAIVAGEQLDFEESRANAWKVTSEVPVKSLFDLYRHEMNLANAIIAATPPDAPPAWWPEEHWPSWRFHDLRETILDVISETAVHAGHFDAVRELIDGRTWLVLTE